MINLDDWEFVNRPHPIDRTLENKQTTIETFCSAKELCKHISENGRGYQMRIQEQIKADPAYKAWKELSPYLKDLPEYKKYRTTEGSRFYNAQCSAAENQKELLSKEIQDSKIILPVGQKLFHGFRIGGDIKENTSIEINHFLSTSLCPEVAIWHSLKGGEYVDTSLRSTLAIIEVTKEVSVIFGCHGGTKNELEMLIDRRSSLIIDSYEDVSGEVAIIEARLV